MEIALEKCYCYWEHHRVCVLTFTHKSWNKVRCSYSGEGVTTAGVHTVEEVLPQVFTHIQEGHREQNGGFISPDKTFVTRTKQNIPSPPPNVITLTREHTLHDPPTARGAGGT